MKNNAKTMLNNCQTLMLDMDGTLLDLAYDNYMWLQRVPETYARINNVSIEAAREKLFSRIREIRGKLDWYCLDHWSNYLGLDIVGLHREENHRIGYLPGAEEFLRDVAARDIRVIMVTNSHLDTLQVKDEITKVTGHFDRIYTSHEFGHPKEDQAFWQAFREEEGFDPATSLFVDDNHEVLASAEAYGISMLVNIMHPDTSQPIRDRLHFAGVEKIRELV